MFYSQPDLGLSSVTARYVLVFGENPFWVAFHPNPAFGLISGDSQMWACFQLHLDLCWLPIVSTVLVSSHPDGLVSNPDLGLSPITRRFVFWSLGHIQSWACFSATTGYLLVPKRSDTHYSALGADVNSCNLTFDSLRLPMIFFSLVARLHYSRPTTVYSGRSFLTLPAPRSHQVGLA